MFLPSKGTGYWMLSVHTAETIDQENMWKTERNGNYEFAYN